jgi:hypothetical protein
LAGAEEPIPREFVPESELDWCPPAEGEQPSKYMPTLKVDAEPSWSENHTSPTFLLPGESASVPMRFRFTRVVPLGEYPLRWHSGGADGEDAFEVHGPAALEVVEPCTTIILVAVILAHEGNEEGPGAGVHMDVDWGWGFEGPKRYSKSVHSPSFYLGEPW